MTQEPQSFNTMTPARFDVEGLRKRLGFNQAEMASKMGLGSRAYFTLEQNPASMNARHIMLAQLVSLRVAVERGDKSLADPEIAKLANEFSGIGRQCDG